MDKISGTCEVKLTGLTVMSLEYKKEKYSPGKYLKKNLLKCFQVELK